MIIMVRKFKSQKTMENKKLSEKQIRWVKATNVVLPLTIGLGIGLLVGVVFGIRSIVPIWLGNEKAYAEKLEEIYIEHGEVTKAKLAKDNYLQLKEVVSNWIFTYGVEPK